MSHSDVWRGHNLGAEQFIEFLVSFGYLSNKDLAYTGTPGRGFLVEPGAGISPGPGKPSIPYKLTDVFDSGIGRLLHSVSDWEQQRTMFQPVQGMEQIPKAIARHLPDGMIRFSTEVQRIRQSGEGVTIDVVTDGQRATMTVDWCICTEINYRLGFEVVRSTPCVATLVKQRWRQAQSGGSQADISTTICLATPIQEGLVVPRALPRRT